MYFESKIRNKQICMVVMSSIALVLGIVSFIYTYWISESAGRISQFFYWAFHKIFNGVAMYSSPEQVYYSVSHDGVFRELNPVFNLELVIFFAFMALVAMPLGILIEFGGKRSYSHFVGLHGLLYGLSVASWIVLPVLVMQFVPGSPIVLGFSYSETVLSLHIWFYFTLLLYIAMIVMHSVTSRSKALLEAHYKIATVWAYTGRAWVIACKVLLVCFSLGFIIIYWCARVARHAV